MSKITIVPIGEKKLDKFIDVPYRIFAKDPFWVPELKDSVKALLSLNHPFWLHGSRKLFVAMRLAYCPSGKKQGGRNFAQSFGALFGLGLSDLSQKLRPLSATQYTRYYETYYSYGGPQTGSDFTFSEAGAGFSLQAELPQRHLISYRLKAIKGFGLPAGQYIPTNRPLSLIGTYAQEYRGAAGVGNSLSLAYYLSKSKRGLLAAEPFAEYARIWDQSHPRSQTGAGINFYYRFWRFPLPLGLSYTYSFENKRSEVTATVGMAAGLLALFAGAKKEALSAAFTSFRAMGVPAANETAEVSKNTTE